MRIGWIGTGVMGAAMCGHLLDAGHEVSVTTRTRSRAEPLLERGAAWAGTPADAADGADVVFSIVGYPADVREVLLGEHGALDGLREGGVCVDMTTSEPSLAVEIAGAAADRGVASVDAPVSGGDRGAREATLSIMVGGADEPVRRVRPLLEAMGKTIVHHGGPGTGQHAKMVNQILIASGMVGLCEGVLYARRAGLSFDAVYESVAGGAAGSWSLSNLAPRMVRGDFDPGFMVEHFCKDMEIGLTEARRLDLPTPGLALAHQLYLALRAQGHGKEGTHALVKALADLSGETWD